MNTSAIGESPKFRVGAVNVGDAIGAFRFTVDISASVAKSVKFAFKSNEAILAFKSNSVWVDVLIGFPKSLVLSTFGKPTKDSGTKSFLSLQAAVQALKNNKINLLVTAPINKNNIQSEKFKFPGHTDYLAQELDGDSLMFMICDELKIGLLTDHVALKEINRHVTKQRIEQKFSLINESLKKDFGIQKPKIAVLSIDPHAGDGGVIGKDDQDILKPVLLEIASKNNLVFGPFSSDSFFGSGQHKKYDAVLAIYHDQGLIPFKTLSFGSGVNYTAGLNKVRTSPDHGTGYDIAGKGLADSTSFKNAIFSAIEIFKSRKLFEDLNKNPLNLSNSKTAKK